MVVVSNLTRRSRPHTESGEEWMEVLRVEGAAVLRAFTVDKKIGEKNGRSVCMRSALQ